MSLGKMLSKTGRVFIFCAADQFGAWKLALQTHAGVFVETAPFMVMYSSTRRHRPPPAACSSSAGMLAVMGHRSTVNSTFNHKDSRFGRRAIFEEYVVPGVGERVRNFSNITYRW